MAGNTKKFSSFLKQPLQKVKQKSEDDSEANQETFRPKLFEEMEDSFKSSFFKYEEIKKQSGVLFTQLIDLLEFWIFQDKEIMVHFNDKELKGFKQGETLQKQDEAEEEKEVHFEEEIAEVKEQDIDELQQQKEENLENMQSQIEQPEGEVNKQKKQDDQLNQNQEKQEERQTIIKQVEDSFKEQIEKEEEEVKDDDKYNKENKKDIEEDEQNLIKQNLDIENKDKQQKSYVEEQQQENKIQNQIDQEKQQEEDVKIKIDLLEKELEQKKMDFEREQSAKKQEWEKLEQEQLAKLKRTQEQTQKLQEQLEQKEKQLLQEQQEKVNIIDLQQQEREQGPKFNEEQEKKRKQLKMQEILLEQKSQELKQKEEEINMTFIMKQNEMKEQRKILNEKSLLNNSSQENSIEKQHLLTNLEHSIKKYEQLLEQTDEIEEKKIIINTLDNLVRQVQKLKNPNQIAPSKKLYQNSHIESQQTEESDFPEINYNQDKASFYPQNNFQTEDSVQDNSKMGNSKIAAVKYRSQEQIETNLLDIFEFYSKQYYKEGCKNTFDQIQHQSSILNLGYFSTLFRDLGLFSGNLKISKQDCLILFKKHASYSKEMTFDQFKEVLSKIAETLYPELEDKTKQINKLYEKLGVLEAGVYKKKIKLLANPFHMKELQQRNSSQTKNISRKDGNGQVKTNNYKFKIQGVSGKSKEEVQAELLRRKEAKHQQSVQSKQNQEKRKIRSQTVQDPNPQIQSASNQQYFNQKQSQDEALTWDQLDNISSEEFQQIFRKKQQAQQSPETIITKKKNSLPFNPAELINENLVSEEDDFYLKQIQQKSPEKKAINIPTKVDSKINKQQHENQILKQLGYAKRYNQQQHHNASQENSNQQQTGSNSHKLLAKKIINQSLINKQQQQTVNGSKIPVLYNNNGKQVRTRKCYSVHHEPSSNTNTLPKIISKQDVNDLQTFNSIPIQEYQNPIYNNNNYNNQQNPKSLQYLNAQPELDLLMNQQQQQKLIHYNNNNLIDYNQQLYNQKQQQPMIYSSPNYSHQLKQRAEQIQNDQTQKYQGYNNHLMNQNQKLINKYQCL